MSSKHFLLSGLTLLVSASSLAGWHSFEARQTAKSLSLSEGETSLDSVHLDKLMNESFLHPRLRGLGDWKRPEGPWRVALQVGHWKASEAPEELKNLRLNTGTSAGNITEWEVALAIAEKTKVLLEAAGVTVEILPTTIPPNYFADVFVSIHADGNTNPALFGYKVAAPRRDYSQRAEILATLLEEEYGAATNLAQSDTITHTMRGYYAFNWQRYEHSLHPLTVATILETGFLTNPSDRRLLVNAPHQSAQGIASGILKFLGMPLAMTSDQDPHSP
jgi:hypothetical protein